MSDIDARIEERVRAFTQDLHVLIGEAAHHAIDEALRGAGAAARPAPAPKPAAAPAPKPAAAAPAPKAASPAAAAPAAPASSGGTSGGKRKPRPKGTRRTADQMVRDLEALRAYVAENPGLTAIDLGKALGMATREMTRPLGKLIDVGDVRKDGVKSHTRYYPAIGRGKKR